MTVRRDLDLLARLGQIEKVHGGAARIGAGSTNEPGFAAKRSRQRLEKDAIARCAAQLVEPGSAIGITAGTTTRMLSRYLRSIPDLTIVTNSLSLADALHPREASEPDVILVGGSRTKSHALVGPVADEALRSLYVDVLFMGVHGMGASGYTAPTLAEAETNQAFIRSSQQLFVLADHTKWGMRALGRIAPLEAAHGVISDSGLADEAAGAIHDASVDLHLADVEPVDSQTGASA